MLRELSVAEQRYQAVLAVIEDGVAVTEVATKVGRQVAGPPLRDGMSDGWVRPSSRS